jgi:tripartite-type tricarboxylate transporter receptor subunit TctC
MSQLSRRALVAGGVLVAVLRPGPSTAQRSATMIAPFAPGASADSVARIVAEKLGQLSSQTIVVENRPGAGGTTGLVALSKSPPDGFTLGIGAAGAMVINPHTAEGDANFAPLTQLTPLAKLVDIPLVIVASKSSGITSLKDMIAQSKSRPDGLSFGTNGTNSAQHLAIEQLKKATGAKMVHVPYRGSALVINDVLGGQIPIGSCDLTSAGPHIAAGAVVALAVTSAQRVPLAPEVPTVAELAVPGYAVDAWLGLFGPPGLAADVTARLSDQVRGVLSDERVVARLRDIGCVPAYLASADFAAYLARESAKMRDLVKA